jgi:CBS domain-containing protein
MDDGNNSEETRKWFLKFGHYICNRLADVGYTLCKGDNMASNPRWCQPLSEWKKMFGQWIGTPESDELLRLQIFFDFRSGAGEVGLCDELREYIHKTAEHKPAFFWNLAADCLRYRPPIGLFGNLKSAEANEEGLSLKNALKPLVGFARLQSLRHSISETGTMARLQRLAEKGVLTGAQRRSACQAFEYLVQLRLRRQSDLMEQGLPPENTVPAGELSDFERDLLKRVFEQIQSIQNQLTREYKGIG